MGILRLLLALSVVFAHSDVFPLTGNRLVGGRVAVQCFFMISGFYMGLVLSEKYTDLRAFYFNRWLRIYPTYLAILLAVTIAPSLMGEPNWAQTVLGSDTLSVGGKALMMMSSLFIFGSDAMMFFYQSPDGLAFTSNFWLHPDGVLWKLHPIPPAWSLPLELYFYALAPFFVRRKLLIAPALLLSILLRVLVFRYVSAEDPWSYRFFPLELTFFLMGMLAYFGYARVADKEALAQFGLIAFVVILLLACNLERVALGNGRDDLFYGLFWLSIPSVFALTRRNRMDRALGELSYSVYICHWPIVAQSARLPDLTGNKEYDILLYVLAASLLLNTLVQEPLERALKAGPSLGGWRFAFWRLLAPALKTRFRTSA